MSWQLSVSKTAKANFAAAVDEAQPSGQDAPGVLVDAMSAKTLIKEFAQRSTAPYLSASAGGHTLQPDEGDGYYNGFSFSVTASREAPTA